MQLEGIRPREELPSGQLCSRPHGVVVIYLYYSPKPSPPSTSATSPPSPYVADVRSPGQLPLGLALGFRPALLSPAGPTLCADSPPGARQALIGLIASGPSPGRHTLNFKPTRSQSSRPCPFSTLLQCSTVASRPTGQRWTCFPHCSLKAQACCRRSTQSLFCESPRRTVEQWG